MDKATKPLMPGRVAKLAGVSTDTLRHYERLGILSKALRTRSGYRIYAPDTLERVTLVRRALQLGFSLSELAEVLRERNESEAPCRRVLNLAENKLRALVKQMQELRQTKRYLEVLVRDWRARLAQTAPGKKAFLLRSLTDKPNLVPRPMQNLKRRRQA